MWLIENNDEFIYDEITGKLNTNDGDFVASIVKNENGLLEIWLDRDACFEGDNIKKSGWNGLENHICAGLFTDEGGGVIKYEKDKNNAFAEETGKIKFIKIIYLEKNLTQIKEERAPTNNLENKFKIFLKKYFNFRTG